MKNLLTLAFLLTVGLYSNSFGQWIPGPPPAGYYPIYRLYNHSLGKHLLTSTIEAQNLQSSGWVNETLMGYSKQSGSIPIYRFYSNASGHFFSTNATTPSGYVFEGIAAYGASGAGPLADGMGRAIYKYTRKKGGVRHLYTSSYGEMGGGNADWLYEGIAFYLFIL